MLGNKMFKRCLWVSALADHLFVLSLQRQTGDVLNIFFSMSTENERYSHSTFDASFFKEIACVWTNYAIPKAIWKFHPKVSQTFCYEHYEMYGHLHILQLCALHCKQKSV